MKTKNMAIIGGKIIKLNMQKQIWFTYSQKTNATTGDINLLKHLRVKMLSFNFSVKVSSTTYQYKIQCNEL